MNRKFTPEHKQFIRTHAKGNDTPSLTALFNKHFSTNFSCNTIAAFRYRHKLLSGIDNKGKHSSPSTEFKPGHKTWNSGTKGLTTKNSGSFQPGQHVWNTNEIGTITMRDDGYLWIKLSNTVPSRFGWKQLHLHRWETEKGPIPKGMKLLFLDSDHHNCDVSNLLLVTSGEMAVINKKGLIKADPELTLSGALIAKILVKTSKIQKGIQEVKS